MLLRQRLVLALCALVLYHQRLEGPLQQHVELQQRLVKASGVASWLLHRQKLVLEIRLELLAGVVEPSGVPVVAHLLQCCYHHKRRVLVLLVLVLYSHRLVLVLLAAPPQQHVEVQQRLVEASVATNHPLARDI